MSEAKLDSPCGYESCGTCQRWTQFKSRTDYGFCNFAIIQDMPTYQFDVCKLFKTKDL